MEDIRWGVISTPLLAMPAATMAFCRAVAATFCWPMELWPRYAWELGGRSGKVDFVTFGRSMPGTEL